MRFGFDLDNYQGKTALSFDMGRNERSTESYQRTGDVLGRVLDVSAPEGHHLTEDFSPELSRPENFERVARTFRRLFEEAARRRP